MSAWPRCLDLKGTGTAPKAKPDKARASGRAGPAVRVGARWGSGGVPPANSIGSAKRTATHRTNAGGAAAKRLTATSRKPLRVRSTRLCIVPQAGRGPSRGPPTRAPLAGLGCVLRTPQPGRWLEVGRRRAWRGSGTSRTRAGRLWGVGLEVARPGALWLKWGHDYTSARSVDGPEVHHAATNAFRRLARGWNG